MAIERASPSLLSLNAQIATLQSQAKALGKKEVAEVIVKVKDAIAHYGLTAADLGLGKVAVGAPIKKARKNSAGKKSARPAKYKDGQGKSWSGVGKRPDWFKAALAAGKTPQDLLA